MRNRELELELYGADYQYYMDQQEGRDDDYYDDESYDGPQDEPNYDQCGFDGGSCLDDGDWDEWGIGGGSAYSDIYYDIGGEG